MKQKQHKQYAGVWLDNQHATIITSEGEEDYSILQKVAASGNQRGGSEHAMNNAKQSDHLKYFKALSAELTSYDEILLFGPGQSQEQLQNHLGSNAQFSNTKISIDTADQLTDPQMIARVRDFFKGRQS